MFYGSQVRRDLQTRRKKTKSRECFFDCIESPVGNLSGLNDR